VLNFNAINNAKVQADPFPYLTATGTLSVADLGLINRDFPSIELPGIFSLSDLTYNGAFGELIEEIRSDTMRHIMEKHFGVDLSDKPLMITVRGRCQRKDGRIHNDSKDKIVTCLLYLNDPVWPNEGGRLRLLRNNHDMDNVIAEVPPNGGNFIAFKRTDVSWHGHEPFEGQRRCIMFNWVCSQTVLSKNVLRHRISAFFKRMGFYAGY